MSLSSVKTRDYPEDIIFINTIKVINVAAYNLSADDVGKVLVFQNPCAVTLTAIDTIVGSQIDIVNYSSGAITFAASGTTLNSKAGALSLATQYTGATMLKTFDNSWIIIGDLT